MSFLRTAGLCLTLSLLAAAPAAAQDRPALFPEERRQLELFAGFAFGSGEVEAGDFGLRATTRRYDRWAYEAGVQKIGTSSSLDLWVVDASAKRYLNRSQKRSYYVLAGPGYFFAEDGFGDGVFLGNIGFGVDITLGEHLFLRPDLRGRFFLEELSTAPFGELTIGLGWRF